MTARRAIGTVAAVEVRVGIASRVRAWWRSVPALLADGALAAGVLAVSLIEVEAGADDRTLLSTALLVAMSLVIVVRRRYPIAVWLASGVLVTIYGVGEFSDPMLPYGLLIAVYTVAAHTSARTAAWTGLITVAVIAVSLLIDPHQDAIDWLIAIMSSTTAWLIGNNVRTQRAYAQQLEARAERLERERQAEADRAVAEERLRIARELHDVAAHHVSVIGLHAEAGQSLLPGDRGVQISGHTDAIAVEV